MSSGDTRFLSDDKFKDEAHRLQAVYDNPNFDQLSMVLRFTYCRYKLLADPHQASIMYPALQLVHDWMHGLFPNGVCSVLMYMLLEEMHARVEMVKRVLWVSEPRLRRAPSDSECVDVHVTHLAPCNTHGICIFIKLPHPHCHNQHPHPHLRGRESDPTRVSIDLHQVTTHVCSQSGPEQGKVPASAPSLPLGCAPSASLDAAPSSMIPLRCLTSHKTFSADWEIIDEAALVRTQDIVPSVICKRIGDLVVRTLNPVICTNITNNVDVWHELALVQRLKYPFRHLSSGLLDCSHQQWFVASCP